VLVGYVAVPRFDRAEPIPGGTGGRLTPVAVAISFSASLMIGAALPVIQRTATVGSLGTTPKRAPTE